MGNNTHTQHTNAESLTKEGVGAGAGSEPGPISDHSLMTVG